jgi:uridine monophosphate synthetase
MDDLLQLIKSKPNIICKKEVELKSGSTSNIYFNIREIVAYPDIIEMIVEEMADYIKYMHYDTICGCGSAGNSLASILSQRLQIPHIIIRECYKNHGLGGNIIGITEKTSHILLVDDVITTGGTVKTTIEKLKNSNLYVTDVLTVLNRSIPYIDKIDNVNVHNLFNMFDFSETFENITELYNYVTDLKKSRLCISCDFSNFITLVEFLPNIAPYAFAIKVHPDIISGFDGNRLRKIANKYRLLIIADMKYSDITSIVEMQYTGPYKVNTWADFVTTQGFVGVSPIEAIRNSIKRIPMGVLLVANMSNGPSISDESAINLATTNKDIVCGFITQRRLSHGINMTPGIGIGEHHRDISEVDSDAYIVGRMVISSKNPAMQCIELTKKINK